MNNPYTGATAGNASNAANTRTFLQQAVDYYPRLVAFSFTLVLPYRETMTEYRSLILRFHSEVWHRTGEYSQERQLARKCSPPTLLRWIWEAASAPECKMVLMMNLDTLGAARHSPLIESVQQTMGEILNDAWQAVTGVDHDAISSIKPIIVNRSERGVFTTPFNQLNALVQAMAVPVATARTGVINA
ncbi:hypothetical protein ENT52713_29930 [Enterobacter sp. 200527-13]|uniref:DUF3296 domain-containing protein n=1 Tax=Enterobacter sp. 200527-13 TaxID=2995131 RepID=UPI0022C185B3|nr:DUF3296 domain-containing protein [Enterobacter sp. 200527-13]GLH25597.1 hypothetical protein ENT52713_29930 [Enterobacter sp. 200527-13]